MGSGPCAPTVARAAPSAIPGGVQPPREVVTVRIEVARGDFARRAADGSLKLATPVPVPFNYGSILGTTGADGDPVDAIVLGPRLSVGATVDVPVHGVVRFVDAGQPDDKWICGRAPGWRDRVRLRWFFRIYVVMKRVRHPGRPTSAAPYQEQPWTSTSAPSRPPTSTR